MTTNRSRHRSRPIWQADQGRPQGAAATRHRGLCHRQARRHRGQCLSLPCSRAPPGAGPPLVVFGSGLSEHDSHLAEALSEESDAPVAVSMLPASKKELRANKSDISGGWTPIPALLRCDDAPARRSRPLGYGVILRAMLRRVSLAAEPCSSRRPCRCDSRPYLASAFVATSSARFRGRQPSSRRARSPADGPPLTMSQPLPLRLLHVARILHPALPMTSSFADPTLAIGGSVTAGRS